MGEALTVIGYPSGLPLKVASGGRVRTVKSEYYVTNLDTYGGNSGSAVFNSTSGEVEGILVRGENDFVSQNGCVVSNRCTFEGCRGEDVTKISEVLSFVPNLPQPPAPTPQPTPGPTPTPQPTPQPSPPPVTQTRTFEVLAQMAIPDNDKNGIESSLKANEAPAGRQVKVGVDISHSYVGDLIISLVAPDGKVYVLQKNRGGRTRDLQGVYGVNLQSDAALGALSNATAGTWKLKVADTLRLDTGSLKSWKLMF